MKAKPLSVFLCAIFAFSVLNSAAMAEQKIIYELPNELIAVEGNECTSVPGSARLNDPLDQFRWSHWAGLDNYNREAFTEPRTVIENESWSLPEYATSATIFL